MSKAQADKRTRLIETATKLAHLRGFRETSLADIAEAANVPVGNVYGSGANSGQGRVDWLCRVERPLWDQAASAALHSSDIVAFRILSLPVLN